MVTEEHPFNLPVVASGIPGTGGFFKQEPADFRVEEIPLYEASGTGPHIYLTVKKEGVSTPQLVRRVAEKLRIDSRDIGYAGLKDAHAIAVQRISIPEGAEQRLPFLRELPGVEVLEAKRHGNKIKRGHLSGNRFTAVIRGVRRGADESARQALSLLGKRGVLNGFDAQRFGSYVNSHRLGRLLLEKNAEGFAYEYLAPEGRSGREEILEAMRREDFRAAAECFSPAMKDERRFVELLARAGPEKALRSIPRRMRGLYISAFQAFLFNFTLERRDIESIDRLFEGDLAWLHRNGAVFKVTDPDAEQARMEAFEISPSGPLYGTKVPLAEGRQGKIEREVAAEYGVEREKFRGAGTKTPGARRPYRVPLWNTEVAGGESEGTLEVSFSLPPGSYATLVLKEIIGGSGGAVQSGGD